MADDRTDTRDEGFAAWLAMNDYLLDAEFLVFDVDDMPDDPYTEEGLRVAEASALDRFESVDAALAPGNREMFDKYVRFVGETFVRGLGAEWTNKAAVDDGKAYIGLKFPWREGTLEVPTMVTSAVQRRSGQEWAFVYSMQKKRRDAAAS